jgi:coenzyme F420-reducing hydrogenase delta subunit
LSARAERRPRLPAAVVSAANCNGCGRCFADCPYAADLQAARDAGASAIGLVCTGMLPPSFIEYALRAGSAGVLITGCADGECEFRFGAHWTEERIARVRAPQLRANVPSPRVRIAWAGRGEERTLCSALAQFRCSLASETASTPQRARSAKRMSAGV